MLQKNNGGKDADKRDNFDKEKIRSYPGSNWPVPRSDPSGVKADISVSS